MTRRHADAWLLRRAAPDRPAGTDLKFVPVGRGRLRICGEPGLHASPADRPLTWSAAGSEARSPGSPLLSLPRSVSERPQPRTSAPPSHPRTPTHPPHPRIPAHRPHPRTPTHPPASPHPCSPPPSHRRRAKFGQVTATTVSWRRIASCNARSGSVGSTPSSSASTVRNRRYTSSASLWRPSRYSASIR